MTRIGNYITCSRISSKDFPNRCRDLLKPCKHPNECEAHISFQNLRNLSKNLSMIWLDPKRFSKDWENEKSIHTGKNGYLNLATNYPWLWKEIEKIKNTIRVFNISISNLRFLNSFLESNRQRQEKGRQRSQWQGKKP